MTSGSGLAPRDSVTLATVLLFLTGAFCGFYWVPVRSLATMGLSGARGTVAIMAAAVVLMLPLVVPRARTILGTNRVALFAIALGGAAFALYSIAFVYGRVAMVILLYFLTPVWSALIGRYVMGWRISRLRVLAIGMGLAGLIVMLSADGTAPVPKNFGSRLR
jgi:drug/metabolite transporter (DMT)-like permease